MKTNQNMIRKMGNFDVIQRTKDGFFKNGYITRTIKGVKVIQNIDDISFNASHLHKQLIKLGLTKKTIQDYIEDQRNINVIDLSLEDDFSQLLKETYYYIRDNDIWMLGVDLSSFLSFFGLDCVFGIEIYKNFNDYNKIIYKLPYSYEEYEGKNDNTFKTYLLKSKGNTYKIGKSKDISTRLKSLKTANPFIELLISIDKDIEEELHAKYSKNNIAGEWFKFNKEEIQEVIKHFKEYTPKALIN